MENETKPTGTETQEENKPDTAQKPPYDSTVELEALKEMYEEQGKTVESLTKEMQELKKANAKLALTQSFTKVETTEEILNKMF